MKIIVGGIISKDNKILLIQEKKSKAYGKWSIPSGRLETGENVFDGAKREIKEETGYDVVLNNLVSITNLVDDEMQDNDRLLLLFDTKIVGGKENIKEDEIMDIKWFTIDEIKNMQSDLRRADLIIPSINNYNNNIKCDLNIINIL